MERQPSPSPPRTGTGTGTGDSGDGDGDGDGGRGRVDDAARAPTLLLLPPRPLQRLAEHSRLAGGHALEVDADVPARGSRTPRARGARGRLRNRRRRAARARTAAAAAAAAATTTTTTVDVPSSTRSCAPTPTAPTSRVGTPRTPPRRRPAEFARVAVAVALAVASSRHSSAQSRRTLRTPSCLECVSTTPRNRAIHASEDSASSRDAPTPRASRKFAIDSRSTVSAVDASVSPRPEASAVATASSAGSVALRGRSAGDDAGWMGDRGRVMRKGSRGRC